MLHAADYEGTASPVAHRDKRLLSLLFAWSVTLVVFVLGPVFLDFSPKLNPGEFLPYSFWEVLEQCEPIISLPLNYFILAQSDLICRRNKRKNPKNYAERTFVTLLFVVGGALYVDGHGMHFGSKIAKHAVEQAAAPFQCFQKTRYNETADLACQGAYNAYMYIRGNMEHVIGHYIYLTGAILIAVSHTLGFRSHVHSHMALPKRQVASASSSSSSPVVCRLSVGQKCAFYLAATLYALLVAGVSIEFPKGFYVVIPLMVLHSLAVVLMAVRNFRDRGWDIEELRLPSYPLSFGAGLFDFFVATLWPPAFDGRALVLQYYLVAYIIAVLPIVSWVIYAGGFIDRETSGMKL